MWDYCEQYLKHSWPWSQSFFDHVKDMGAPNVSQLGDRNLLGIGVRQFLPKKRAKCGGFVIFSSSSSSSSGVCVCVRACVLRP